LHKEGIPVLMEIPFIFTVSSHRVPGTSINLYGNLMKDKYPCYNPLALRRLDTVAHYWKYSK
jgi:hypothetical protein